MYTIRRWLIELKENSHPEYSIELIAESCNEAIKLAQDLYGPDSLSEPPKEIKNGIQ